MEFIQNIIRCILKKNSEYFKNKCVLRDKGMTSSRLYITFNNLYNTKLFLSKSSFENTFSAIYHKTHLLIRSPDQNLSTKRSLHELIEHAF